MPCKYRNSDYSCDFGFSEVDLANSRCPLHIDPHDPIAFSDSRREHVQSALNALLDRRERKEKPVTLVGVVVPKGVRFAGRTLRRIAVSDSQFGGGDHFVGAIFDGDAEFSNSNFRDVTSFSGAHFKNALNFQCEATGLDFTQAKFDGKVQITLTVGNALGGFYFHGCRFNDEVVLGMKNELRAPLGFSGSDFRSRFHLEGNMRSEINFSEVRFGGKTSFTGRSLGYFSADGCDFQGRATFSRATFEGGVDFSESMFRSEANFVTRFSGVALFKSCRFHGKSDFSAMTAKDASHDSFEEIDFSGSEFFGDLIFTNRKFLSTANFERCAFHLAPQFHGATLHQDTRFPRIHSFLQLETENAAAAYRTLRQAMERNNARREEAMFYALEQKTLRRIPNAQSKWENFASAFYDVVTGYGVNFWRPLGYLGLIAMLFGGIFALWMSWPLVFPSSVDTDRLGKGLAFSLQQVVNPFWIWRIDGDEIWSDSPNLVRVVATIESLFTTGLFALSLLALRWRFKRE